MPTAEQQSLIDTLRELLEAEPGVEAVWLAGSLGKGGGDAFSDVDLLVLVDDGGAGELTASLSDRLDGAVKPVLVNKLYGGRVINVVTDDWRRFDLSIVEGADLDRYAAAELKGLFNRGHRAPPDRPDTPYQTPPDRLLPLVQEFLRVIGLSVGAMGREEYELGLNGVDLLRRMTMDLMLEENGVGPAQRGGALRRNPFLTADQRAELAAIPPISAERRSVLAANRVLAAIFLPRARRLAESIGMAWPTEDATRRNLKLKLDLDI
jgi:predicted nucleotidyltransferase